MSVPSDFRCESPEVFYRSTDDIQLKSTVFEQLRTAAEAAPRDRARICLHEHPGVAVHEMLIMHKKETYIQPHRHLGREESLVVVQGTASLKFFDDLGGVIRVATLGDFRSGMNWYARIPANQFHTLVISSDWFLFLEVTAGPFRPDSTERSAWSPTDALIDKRHSVEAQHYLHSLEKLTK